MNLRGISGSLRADSTNSRLLQAATIIGIDGITLAIEQSVSVLPHFSPDLLIEDHSSVLGFADRVRQCDGLIISCPVYAGGYPGAFKNALDWLVGTDVFIEKPFIMLSTSNRVPRVEKSLVSVLETLSGIHISSASTTIPLLGKTLSSAEIAEEFSSQISDSLLIFKREINAIQKYC